MAEDGPPPGLSETARFQVSDDTLPPGTRGRPSPGPAVVPSPRRSPAAVARRARTAGAREVFRGLEKGLMEVDFSGKVFIKQGTIYSYSGNLTFWVKDKRAGARPALVIVTGTGRLILTDQEREITFMQVADEPVFVEPNHLLACEEGLQPRYVRLGDEVGGVEVVALEGRGMVALSVAEQAAAAHRQARPARVGAGLVRHHVDGPARPARRGRSGDLRRAPALGRGASGRLLRLEGTGRILVEQAAG